MTKDPEPLKGLLAVGISRRSGKESYSLAIRASRKFSPGNPLAHPKVLPTLGELAVSKEIDLAFVDYHPRRTLQAGTSCGHYKITAGTLGGFVTASEDRQIVYVLSCNHVLANSNAAFGGDPIWQPGPSDLRGTAPDTIASLSDWYPLSTEPDLIQFDAAIAELIDGRYYRPCHVRGFGDHGSVPVLRSQRRKVMNVVKRGRTTNLTRGTVSAFELDGIVMDFSPDPADPKHVQFNDCIEFVGDPPHRPFSQPGDSGSWIFDADSRRVYALLFGGGVDAFGVDRTLGHFMPDVLKHFAVKIAR